MAEYTKIGNYESVPLADAQNLVSNVNRPDDMRKTYKGTGKYDGKPILVEISAGVFAKCFALGKQSYAAWQRCDGAAQYTPVNINPATAGFTVGGTTTFTSTTGVLTTGGTNAATDRAYQTVALKAGTYRLDVSLAGKGASASAYKTARVRITSGAVTAGVGATAVASAVGGAAHINASAAASAVKDDQSIVFTIPADANVTFTLDVVDQAGALAAETTYAKLSVLHAVNP